MTKDSVDFVRQGAYIALGMILVQQSEASSSDCLVRTSPRRYPAAAVVRLRATVFWKPVGVTAEVTSLAQFRPAGSLEKAEETPT